MNGIIYKLRNKLNRKCYIGQTTNSVEIRLAGHFRTKESPIGRALRKYGLQSFSIKILDTASSLAILNEKEVYWISRYKTMVSQGGYNIAVGGGGTVGVKLTKERKAAVAAANKRRPAPMTGRNHTIEARQKMSLASKGRKLSPEWRRKIGLAGKGRRHTPETCEKIRQAKLGKPRPDLALLNKQRALIHLVKTA